MIVGPLSSSRRPSRSRYQARPSAEPTFPIGKVSLIIACYGQLDYTKNLLASLAVNSGAEDLEVILVDNGCPEGTADWSEAQGIKTIRMGENAGVPRAYNEGVKVATGELIGVWNNDMICLPDGVLRLARASYERGMAAQSGGMWNAKGQYVAPTMAVQWTDYAECYALIAQRQVWEDVGEWDPIFDPSYSDDADFCMRARLLGYEWKLVEGAVTHFGGKTSCGMAGINEKVAAHQQIIRDRYLPLGLGQRLLVKRQGAYGDMLLATPAFRALKKELPLARLHVQCAPQVAPLLQGNPHVDWAFTEARPLQPYTRTIDLNDAYEAGQREGLYLHPALAFCDVAGVAYDMGRYELTVPQSLLDWAARRLPEGRFIACGIRSGHRSKQNWHGQGWWDLAQSIPEGTYLLALDAAPNPPLGHGNLTPEDVAFYTHPRVINLTGQTETFMAAAAFVALSQAFVGVDSGLLHAASALGLPIVNLCAAAPLASRLPLTGKVVGFAGQAPCLPCVPESCTRIDGPHCLAHFTGAAVANALRGLLA